MGYCRVDPILLSDLKYGAYNVSEVFSRPWIDYDFLT